MIKTTTEQNTDYMIKKAMEHNINYMIKSDNGTKCW